VEPADFEGTGRGMRCTRAARQGKLLLEVPLGECWSEAAALQALPPALAEAAAARGWTAC